MSETAAIQTLRNLFEGIRDERRMYSNTATRIGSAFLSLLSYLTDDSPYIHKDQEDSTNYLLKLIAGAVIGEGKIKLNPDGSITCNSIKVDGSAIFNELVFNHQNVLEGDTYFTDRAIIDTVQHTDVNQYKLTFRKMYANDVHTFHVFDILRSSVNNLDANRTFRTSWARVDSVDTSTNSVTVTMFDNDDVPGGTNYSPSASSRVIRWGNQKDTERQRVFFISQNDGRFLYLEGVDKPIINDSNYAAFIGVPPDMDILKDLPVNKKQPYIYARGLIVQDIIRIDYKGQPIYTTRDLGAWQDNVQYIHGAETTADGTFIGYFTDRVWFGGCYWQCAVDKATIGKQPRYNNADYIILIGKGDFTLDIDSSAGDFFNVNKEFTTTLTATLNHALMEITESEIGKENITWTRESDDTTADAAWNAQHLTGTLGLTLDIKSIIDMPTSWYQGKSVAFRCSINLDNTKLTQVYEL
jgi:hypothetical protein